MTTHTQHNHRFFFSKETWTFLFLTLLSITVLINFVDLQPHVDQEFFFSSDDPQFQADKQIDKIFPMPEQIIISVRGDIYSKSYQEKIESLSRHLLAMPEVTDIQSLSNGPSSLKDALKSPLWSRHVIAKNREATFLFVSVKSDSNEKLAQKIEIVRDRFRADDFEFIIMMVSMSICIITAAIFIICKFIDIGFVGVAKEIWKYITWDVIGIGRERRDKK